MTVFSNRVTINVLSVCTAKSVSIKSYIPENNGYDNTVYVGGLVNITAHVNIQGNVPGMYASVPIVLVVNGKEVSKKWLTILGSNSGEISFNVYPKKEGKYEVYVKVCKEVHISSKQENKECSDGWIESNHIIFYAKEIKTDEGVTKTIGGSNRTKPAVFRLHGGKYVMVVQRSGDSYPRAITVTEDYPPGDSRAKVILSSVFVAYNPPEQRFNVTVDDGVHNVYVLISGNIGEYKVTFVRL